MNLIKVEVPKDCKGCSGTGAAVHFYGGVGVVCHCVAERISVDGKKSIAQYIEEHTEG